MFSYTHSAFSPKLTLNGFAKLPPINICSSRSPRTFLLIFLCSTLLPTPSFRDIFFSWLLWNHISLEFPFSSLLVSSPLQLTLQKACTVIFYRCEQEHATLLKTLQWLLTGQGNAKLSWELLWDLAPTHAPSIPHASLWTSHIAFACFSNPPSLLLPCSSMHVLSASNIFPQSSQGRCLLRIPVSAHVLIPQRDSALKTESKTDPHPYLPNSSLPSHWLVFSEHLS